LIKGEAKIKAGSPFLHALSFNPISIQTPCGQTMDFDDGFSAGTYTELETNAFEMAVTWVKRLQRKREQNHSPAPYPCIILIKESRNLEESMTYNSKNPLDFYLKIYSDHNQ
jgi:hypothetical protein